MKIIAIHNYYQHRGGEDQLFEDEAKLLEENGHELIWYTQHSDSIKERSLFGVAIETLWNRRTHAELSELIKKHSPDVIHSVNTFPLFSPSIFHAARKQNIPFVATIQNYRYFCAQAMCYRNGKACEQCLGKIPWRAVKYGCYKDSTAGSLVVAMMQLMHQQLRSWQRHIDVVCVASEFSRNKLLQAGLDEHQMMVKPNFVAEDPGLQPGEGGYAVFVGRISNEKGIHTLVDAWRYLDSQGINVPLKVVGDGPDSEAVKRIIDDVSCVEWIGHLPNDNVIQIIGDASCLIFPSTGYESLPKTLIESMAVGTPVAGSNIGSIPEIVIESETGYLFEAGNEQDLASCVLKFFNKSGEGITNNKLRSRCRDMFEERFTSRTNYAQLMNIYSEAIRRRQLAVGRNSTLADNTENVAVPESNADAM